jgi:BirA family transcriptional regulator, biotin operon repressor / biotin---[acetyl-CoA-carboxylase] ligase
MPLRRAQLPPHDARTQALSQSARRCRQHHARQPFELAMSGPLTDPSSGHLNWGAQALWQSLEPLLPGLFVEVLAHADSTNTRLLERARESNGLPQRTHAVATRPGDLAPSEELRDERTPRGRRMVDVQPCLLVAERQTRGRGRLGRGWVSGAGTSLTFSLSLPLAPAQWDGLSLAVGLAIAQALEPLTAGAVPRLVLKWPNDLWLQDAGEGVPGHGRKLGGILIETIQVGERRMCVVGVGLNVLPAQESEDVSRLAHGYACLQEIDPEASAPAVLARIARPLVQALLRFQDEGFAPLQAAYSQRDMLRGQAVTTTLAGVPQGVAEGVDERGALQVRHNGLHHVVSGEVSVRLHSSSTASPGASSASTV